MENVTDRVRNPFGMRPPCPHRCDPGSDRTGVLGYGDANADFHVIGDHPNVHGGGRRGIPFTGVAAGERVLDVLEAVGFLSDRDAEDPTLENCFLSYLHCCCLPAGESPTDRAYVEFERFFDAELRAIAAHVLVPVGERATRHVLWEYTSLVGRVEVDLAALHATQLKGRGFLVVPLQDPDEWGPDGYDRGVTGLWEVLAGDYRQEVDLGRFLGPDGLPYRVR